MGHNLERDSGYEQALLPAISKTVPNMENYGYVRAEWNEVQSAWHTYQVPEAINGKLLQVSTLRGISDFQNGRTTMRVESRFDT